MKFVESYKRNWFFLCKMTWGEEMGGLCEQVTIVWRAVLSPATQALNLHKAAAASSIAAKRTFLFFQSRRRK